MGFDNDRVGLGAIPRPVNLVRRDAVKISRFAKKAALLDKEPDFAFKHVVDLLCFVSMRCRVITGARVAYMRLHSLP